MLLLKQHTELLLTKLASSRAAVRAINMHSSCVHSKALFTKS
jgi:hypothetical protein